MLRKPAALLTAAIALVLSGSVSAQVGSTVDMNSLTVEELVFTLTGPENGLQVWNETYTGHATAAGRFAGGASVFGPLMDEGIILSSGDIHGDCGPANSSTGYGPDHGLPGDSALDLLVAPFTTNDASVLEFDFSCEDLQEISFLFVFSSEEYNEYVFSLYNDVFAFYVDGVNVALVPVAGTVPVTIDNVNLWTNPSYYLNNVAADGPPFANLPIQMDGMTVVLAAYTPLAGAPGDPHHMKFAIADTSDHVLDSAVFIAANTFNCGDPLVVDLGYFDGRMRPNGDVMLIWGTLSEIDTLGFNIYREPWSTRPLEVPSPGAVLINTRGMIPARGSLFEPMDYRWLDATSQMGSVYHYWLEDIDTNGRSTLHGPIGIR